MTVGETINGDRETCIREIFRETAVRHGMRLEYNTHYDAYNYVISWWDGTNHHRLDFQPIDDSLAVTHYIDRYKRFQHICHWLHSRIPEIFPFPPSIQFMAIGTISMNQLDQMGRKVEEVLNQVSAAVSNGSPTNPIAG